MIIRMKNIQRQVHGGRTYLYHRHTRVRLDVDATGRQRTPEEIHAAWAREEARHHGRARPVGGTLGALIVAYRASPEFIGLAAKTRRDYARILDWLKPLADQPLTAIDTPRVMKIRDRAAERGHRWPNYVLAVLSRLFSWGKPRGITTGNPVEDAERVRRPKGQPKGNRAWTPDELAFVLAAAPEPVRLAVLIAAYTGQREGDVIRMSWAAYDGHAIQVRQQKTGQLAWVPAHPALREALDAAERRATTIVVRERAVGRGPDGAPIAGPYTVDGFRSVFFRLVGDLEQHEAVPKGLTFHGLRHTAGVALAEAGCSALQIAAVLACTQPMAENYVRTADRKVLAGAAIERLVKHQSRRRRPARKDA